MLQMLHDNRHGFGCIMWLLTGFKRRFLNAKFTGPVLGCTSTMCVCFAGETIKENQVYAEIKFSVALIEYGGANILTASNCVINELITFRQERLNL